MTTHNAQRPSIWRPANDSKTTQTLSMTDSEDAWEEQINVIDLLEFDGRQFALCASNTAWLIACRQDSSGTWQAHLSTYEMLKKLHESGMTPAHWQEDIDMALIWAELRANPVAWDLLWPASAQISSPGC